MYVSDTTPNGVEYRVLIKINEILLDLLNTYRRSFSLSHIPRIPYGAIHIKPLCGFAFSHKPSILYEKGNIVFLLIL